jgi:hypothetical protein
MKTIYIFQFLLFCIPVAIEVLYDRSEMKTTGRDDSRFDVLLRGLIIFVLSIADFLIFGHRQWGFFPDILVAMLLGAAIFNFLFDQVLNLSMGWHFFYRGKTKKYDIFFNEYFPTHILIFWKVWWLLFAYSLYYYNDIMSQYSWWRS